MPELSVVIPCYNEADNIESLITRFGPLLSRLPSCELIFVNDGSRDQTGDRVRALATRSNLSCAIRLVELSKNFGHQKALLAGMRAARGAACVTIDADLQDPPELIVEMVSQWRAGYEVVLGQRLERRSDSFLKRGSATLFYKMMSYLTNGDFPPHVGDFRLVSRRVLDILVNLPERSLYWRGLVIWVGYKRTLVQYERQPRHAGESHYPFFKMVLLALDAVFSFSKQPLYLSSIVGIMTSFVSLVLIGVHIFLKITGAKVFVPGWMSMMAVMTFLGGLQLFCLGIVGQYVGRIFDQVIDRPQVLSYEPEEIRSETVSSPSAKVVGLK
jgi:dolichol-phosphate mannosyltransferase